MSSPEKNLQYNPQPICLCPDQFRVHEVQIIKYMRKNCQMPKHLYTRRIHRKLLNCCRSWQHQLTQAPCTCFMFKDVCMCVCVWVGGGGGGEGCKCMHSCSSIFLIKRQCNIVSLNLPRSLPLTPVSDMGSLHCINRI